MSFFKSTIDDKVPALVREYLAADATDSADDLSIRGWFGLAGIRVHEYEELAAPFPAPYLAVTPGPLVDRRQLGQDAQATYNIDLHFFLARQSPALPADVIARPATPAVAAGAAGLLTGAYRYALTGRTAAGEGFASDLSAVLTLAAQKGAVTIPALGANLCYGLYRTKAGRTSPQFLDNVFTAGTYVDNWPDATLWHKPAPDVLGATKLFSRIRRVIVAEGAETLRNILPGGGGVSIAQATTSLADISDKVSAERNQREKVIRITYEIRYRMSDRQSTLG